MTPSYFWLQPLVTGVAAMLVLIGAGITVWQRNRADRKSQWWDRTRWALELTIDADDERQFLGFTVLAQQVSVNAADQDDPAFVTEVVQPRVDAYLAAGDNGDDGSPTGVDSGAASSSGEAN